MSVTVQAVTDAPTAANKTITIGEDSTYTFASNGGVILLPNDSDFGFNDPKDQNPPSSQTQSDHLQNIIINSVINGTLLDNGNPITSFPATIPVIDLTSGNLKFQPAANKNTAGGATFTVNFQLQDSGGTAVTGSADTSTPKSITFNVQAINDPPSGQNFTRTINENENATTPTSSYTFGVTDFSFSDSSLPLGSDIAANGGSPVHAGGDTFTTLLITSAQRRAASCWTAARS